MKKEISTKDAPQAIGPYNQAIEMNGMVFFSGQIPMDPATSELVGDDIAAQSHQVFKNIKAVLAACDLNFDNIVKTTCFLTDLSLFGQFNEIYASYFEGSVVPARSTIEVSALPKGSLVEVEIIAMK
ncbi:MAG: RidA family protein [Bacteroidales bacterium]|nr:RidA family protein [Bacteroidales bacterium]